MLYIFDLNEQLQAVLKNNGAACPYFDAIHTEKLADTLGNTFTFSVPANHADARYVTEGNLVAFKDLDLAWQLFEIKRIVDLHGDGLTRTAFCEHACYELIDDMIEDLRPTDCSATFALTQALTGTRWSVGTVDDLGTNSTNYYYESALSAVQKVASVWGGELQFRVVVTGGVIAHRYVDVLTRRGADTGKQFAYGRHMQEIEREEDLTETKTALYGRGKGVETDSGGFGRRLTFADVVWATPTNPVNKPAGQEWVGDPDALAAWGRAGGTRHRFGTFEDSEETDAATLLQKTWDALQERNTPRMTYTMTVMDLERLSGYSHEAVRLGDTTRCIDRVFSPALLVSARVIEIARDLVRPHNTKITLGNFAPTLADNALTQQRVNKAVSAAFSPKGTLATAWLDGVINVLQNEINNTAAYVFQTAADGILIMNAATFAEATKAMKIGGGTFALANSKTGNAWNWRTFGDGAGFTANEMTAGTINTSLVKIAGNTYFYWDGDYLYIINPADQNQQIRLSKEGIRFTKDGGTTWLVAMDFDGIRMEGTSEDGYTHYTGDGAKVYDTAGSLVGHLGRYQAQGAAGTFARASTKYKKNGTAVASGTPTFEAGSFANGVHMEEAGSNVLLYSQEFDNAAWVKGGTPVITPNAATAPDGTTTADQIQDDDAAAGEQVYQTVTIANDSTSWTASIYVKKDAVATRFPALFLQFVNGTTQVVAEVRLNTSTGATAIYFGTPAVKVDSLTDFWRLSITLPNNSTGNTLAYVNFFPARASTIDGDPDVTATGSCTVWGAKLENKAYPTSYISTASVAASRNADSLYYDLTSPLPSEWFLSGRFIPDQASTIGRGTSLVLAMLYYDANNYIMVWFNPNNDTIVFSKIYAGTAVTLASVAISYSAGDTVAFGVGQLTSTHNNLPAGMHLQYRINSGAVVHVSNADTNLPTAPTKVYVGCDTAAGYEANGVIDALHLIDVSKVAGFDNAWAEAQLTATEAPKADAATVLLCNFDDTLSSTVARYGLWSKNGYFIMDAPPVGGGIIVRDASGNERLIIGQYATGKYGAKVIDGEIYSSTIRSGSETDTSYIQLSPGDQPLLVKSNGKDALEIWSDDYGGIIRIYKTDIDSLCGEISSDVSTNGLLIQGRTSGGIADKIVTIAGSNIYLTGTPVFVSDYLDVGGDLMVWGDFAVAGSGKGCIVQTASYGRRWLYAVEGPDIRLEIKGLGQLTDGECRIDLNPKFLETIEQNLEQAPWIIGITSYFDGKLYVAEIGSSYFVVKECASGIGTGQFAWSLSAVKIGCIDIYMPEFEPRK